MLLKVSLNMIATVALISLISLPILFIQKFGRVAGAKTTSHYFLISQIEKFPGFHLSQTSSNYIISFSKEADKQAYMSILILSNPTSESRTYRIRSSSTDNKLFFGEQLNNLTDQITLPPGATANISLLSESINSSQNFNFQIDAN